MIVDDFATIQKADRVGPRITVDLESDDERSVIPTRIRSRDELWVIDRRDCVSREYTPEALRKGLAGVNRIV